VSKNTPTPVVEMTPPTGNEPTQMQMTANDAGAVTIEPTPATDAGPTTPVVTNPVGCGLPLLRLHERLAILKSAVSSTMCLDLDAPLRIASCDPGSQSQVELYIDQSTCLFTVRRGASYSYDNKAGDILTPSTSCLQAGGALSVATCDAQNANQKWKATLDASGTLTLRSSGDQCLSLSGSTPSLATCDASQAQQLTFETLENAQTYADVPVNPTNQITFAAGNYWDTQGVKIGFESLTSRPATSSPPTQQQVARAGVGRGEHQLRPDLDGRRHVHHQQRLLDLAQRRGLARHPRRRVGRRGALSPDRLVPQRSQRPGLQDCPQERRALALHTRAAGRRAAAPVSRHRLSPMPNTMPRFAVATQLSSTQPTDVRLIR